MAKIIILMGVFLSLLILNENYSTQKVVEDHTLSNRHISSEIKFNSSLPVRVYMFFKLSLIIILSNESPYSKLLK